MSLFMQLPGVAVLALLSGYAMASPVNDAECSATHLSLSINDFGFNVIQQLNKDGNLLISPFSIYVALVMLYEGARGQTALEIENAFQMAALKLGGDDLSSEVKHLMETYEKKYKNVKLQVANGVFVQQGIKVKERYIKNMENLHQTALRELNFESRGEEARNEINEFVRKATNDAIKEMLSSPPSPSTNFVLINAVYFKGTWDTLFDPEETREDSFYVGKNATKQVKFMNMGGKRFSFYEEKETGYKFLELPYKGLEMSMLLALPGSFETRPAFIADTTMLCQIRSKCRTVKLERLSIPRFQLSYEDHVERAIRGVGVNAVFTPQSDLSGITDDSSVRVSAVLHKAVIDVNETGTEAAAATNVMLLGSSLYEEYAEFVANRPFLFYVIDNKRDLVLFAGRVSEP